LYLSSQFWARRSHNSSLHNEWLLKHKWPPHTSRSVMCKFYASRNAIDYEIQTWYFGI
jgi:hypothetical protein